MQLNHEWQENTGTPPNRNLGLQHHGVEIEFNRNDKRKYVFWAPLQFNSSPAVWELKGDKEDIIRWRITKPDFCVMSDLPMAYGSFWMKKVSGVPRKFSEMDTIEIKYRDGTIMLCDSVEIMNSPDLWSDYYDGQDAVSWRYAKISALFDYIGMIKDGDIVQCVGRHESDRFLWTEGSLYVMENGHVNGVPIAGTFDKCLSKFRLVCRADDSLMTEVIKDMSIEDILPINRLILAKWPTVIDDEFPDLLSNLYREASSRK